MVKGGKRRIPYRRPILLTFTVGTFLMWLLTHMSFIAELGPDEEIIVTPPGVASSLLLKVYFDYFLLPFHYLGLLIFGSISVIRVVCVLAHLLHVAETLYAVKLCVEHNVGLGASVLYAFFTFLGGISQLQTLKSAIREAKA